MNIAQLLYRSAQTHGPRPAVLLGAEVRCDYATLGARVAALATHLQGACNVRPGDRVVIYAANCPEYLELMQAVYLMGAVTVPANYKLHPRELAHVLQDSGAVGVWAGAALHAAALQAGADPQRLYILGDAAYEARSDAAHPGPHGGSSPGGFGFAVLYLGYYGQVQGGHANAPQFVGHDPVLFQ